MPLQRSFVLRLLVIVGVCGGIAFGGRLGAPTASAAEISTEHVLVATLLGAAEVNGAGTPGQGDADGRGSAIIDIEPDSLSICYVLRVTGIASAAAAHIHQAGADANGSVVVSLNSPGSGDLSTGCTTATAGLITEILATPSAFYVNVHNAAFPGGAIRGQLGLTTMTTGLTGAAEVNNAGEPNQGDADGTGSATITVDGGNVCYVIRAEDITLPAAGAHIHNARAGANGPVVVPLAAPNADGIASGCVEGTIEAVAGLRTTPSNFYVNVHTSDFPAGAVRGQLSSSVFSINLSGGAEVNAVGEPNQGDLDGVGTAGLILDAVRGDVCYVLRVADITLPAAGAHIHEAPTGQNGPVVVSLTAPGADGVASGCATASAEQIEEIAETPAKFYVNVHTSDFGAGALRGQLAGTVFRTTLTGAAEVNGAGDPNQGDLDGIGTAVVTLDAERGDVCFVLRVAGITLPAAGAHIHEAPAGQNGPVVVSLTAPGADGVASGCAAASVEQIEEIAETPAKFYVNVHTSDFGAGAVRGQLAGTVFRTSLSGAAEVNTAGEPNQGAPYGTGTAVVTLDAEQGDVCFVLRVADITLPAAGAHIHEAPAGQNGPVVVPLTAPGVDGVASGCADATEALINSILATPANFYVNIHTSDYPAGAVRGQLVIEKFVVSLPFVQR